MKTFFFLIKIINSKVIDDLNFGCFGSSRLLMHKCCFFKFCSHQVNGTYQRANLFTSLTWSNLLFFIALLLVIFLTLSFYLLYLNVHRSALIFINHATSFFKIIFLNPRLNLQYKKPKKTTLKDSLVFL